VAMPAGLIAARRRSGGGSGAKRSSQSMKSRWE
jgi:hypothetical protein